jgi:hypothetical protein
VIYDVLCHEMTMYCCEDWIVIDYVKTCIVFVVCMYIFCDLFWRFSIPGGNQNRVHIKNPQYLCQLTEEHNALCSSVNQGIYATHDRSAGQGQAPNIFIGDVKPTNIR